MNRELFKRAWLYLRTGYSTYLIFIFGGSNFILILYGLAPEISDNIDFIPFALVMVIAMPLLAILIGRKHWARQFGTEAKVQTENNPYMFLLVQKSKDELLYKIQIDMIDVMKGILLETDPEKKKELAERATECQKLLSRLLNGEDSRNII